MGKKDEVCQRILFTLQKSSKSDYPTVKFSALDL